MRISSTGRNEAGLTLVELLVVLAIIGLSTALVVVAAPRKGSDLAVATRLVEREVAGLRDSAVSRSALFALAIDAARLDRFEAKDGAWTLIEQTTLPAAVGVTLETGVGWSLPEHEEEVRLGGVFQQTEEAAEEEFRPPIVFTPEGSVTPFSVLLRQDQSSVIIRVGPFGRVTVDSRG
ncbi:MAG: prepilin-type N-terminal cleavage/methylation domain-containing protein [Pseudomonadota bacterium]